MKKLLVIYLAFNLLFGLFFSCGTESISPEANSLSQTVLDVAQTSGQLASGTSFQIAGSSTDSTSTSGGKHGGRHGHNKHKGIIDGLRLLAPTEELLAIIDAETASDFRGLRISKSGGATITHYNANGEVVALSINSEGPQGCSFSGKQFPEYDSLLATIVETEIDFGTGVTYKRDTIEITRVGKIVITRSGDSSNRTEVTTFENYSVNGYDIEGTKTRTTTYNSTTGYGTSNTSVADGKIIFPDGTEATWLSNRSRISDVTRNASGKPESGTITTEVSVSVVLTDGTVVYAHNTNDPLIENIACEGRRRGPVSGILETNYRENNVLVDYGDGTCGNKTITITVNGVTTTKTIGG